MNIMIVGCDRVGQALAEQLGGEGNNVTVIDLDADKVRGLTARLDVKGVIGNGATHTVQEEAGIREADLLIAVTGSDELNLLCCLIAKKAGNHCKTIARIQDPDYSAEAPYLKEELGLAMVINPEYAAAAEIARVLRFPSAIKIDTFARGRVELMKFRMPEGSRLVGMTVRDVVAKLGCDVLVCTIERGDEAYIANGNSVFAERDIISIVASPRNAADFFRKIDYKMRPVKRVIVAGGGEIAHYLCTILRPTGTKVKIIEKDHARAEELSVGLGEVDVIEGDASDRELLLEEGIRGSEAFVALTNMDEENIFLSLFAKSVGCGKVITKINRVDFDDVIKHLDLDSTLYPKNVTADMIVRYVRAMKNSMGSNMETLYNIIKGKVEAAEFKVREESAVTDTPLKELTFKDQVLIAAIIHEEQVIIPRGHDCIRVGDRVIVVSRPMGMGDISDILL